MRILLHTCCAPCLIYPLERLRGQGFEVEGFFYNPNIQPYTEYKNRKNAVVDFSQAADVKVGYPEYKSAEFFQVTNLKEDKPARCAVCWELRLKRTAKQAKEKGFEAFTTTLLVSPYQGQELLKRIGSDIAKEAGIEFYYEDFRPGFKRAHNQAKEKGIYCQRYCGCIYSELERYKKSKIQILPNPK